MRLQVKFKAQGYADCDIRICAKGAILATVYWATETGPLTGWSSLAAIPIAPSGDGEYSFGGQRAIPPEATHIYAHCVTPDFLTVDEAYAEIPDFCRPKPEALLPRAMFSLMSDLHLSGKKSGKAGAALSQATCPVILMAGDMTNDGFPEEFAALEEQIERVASDKPILSVAGNHDFMLNPAPETLGEYGAYRVFQENLLRRARAQGIQVEMDDSGAYAATVDGVEIFGLQCVTDYRRFVFPEGAQLKWLARRLEENSGWHIVLCHAPLLTHNPQRSEYPAYLSRDEQLQKIIDTHEKIIFISGHTHISPNGKRSCVEYVPETQTLYINTGSVVPTQLSGEPLMPSEWKDGVVMELLVYADALEVRTKSVTTGIFYPRGFYRFNLPER